MWWIIKVALAWILFGVIIYSVLAPEFTREEKIKYMKQYHRGSKYWNDTLFIDN